MTARAPDLGLDEPLDWTERLKAIEASSNHIDPYTLWSLQSAFRQHVRRGGPELRLMDFLVELDRPYAEVAARWPAWFVVPTIYAQAMPGSKRTARHVTVRLSIPQSVSALADAIWALILRDDVRRAQIGFPRPAFPGEALPLDVVFGEPPRGGSHREAAASPKVLLGVLEDACPFGHAALQTRDGTRVVALWDQSLADAAHDAPPAGLGYGRERRRGDLQALLREHSDARGIDEEALYRDPRALQPRLRGHQSHAAAVIGLLAGRPACLPSHPRSGDDATASDQRPHRHQAAADDGAAAAPLAVVQFPREQIDIAGARWLVVRALDGLRYLADVSAGLSPPGRAPLPLVVNLSYGSVVGAHDGTALLETAMAELAQAHRRMAIVLAAGNSHGTERRVDKSDAPTAAPQPGDVRQRLPGGRHAECASLMPSKSTTLTLYVPPNKPIETYLEIWFDDCAARRDAEQFLGPDEVRIEVVSPVGQHLRMERLPGVAFDNPIPRHTCAGLLGLRRVAQSRLRSMVLLVVAATQISSRRVEVPSGAWSVRVTNRGSRELRVSAWVERDLLPGTGRRSQAARLLAGAADDAEAARLTDDDTFNNIATGERVFRVGALTWLAPGGRPAVSPYSSAAGAGRRGPEFSAVADMSPALAGIRVSGNGSGSVARVNGTSVAAPQVSRWLANQLAAGLGMAQIRRLIARGKGGNGRRGKISV
jgi:hypothetical protein